MLLYVQRIGHDVAEFHWEDGLFVRMHRSLDEDQIMAENGRIRAENRARTLSFGRPIARLSFEQLKYFEKKFPALASRDRRECHDAWVRLVHDPEYRALTVKG
jgi:hypothetical protein